MESSAMAGEGGILMVEAVAETARGYDSEDAICVPLINRSDFVQEAEAVGDVVVSGGGGGGGGGILDTATAPRYAYVGVPIDGPEEGGELRGGGVNRGVGRDLTGAESAALESARRDNAPFVEKKRFTEAQARSRVEAEARAIGIGRLNAKKRDLEGLAMRPHPGNRLEPGLAGSSRASYDGCYDSSGGAGFPVGEAFSREKGASGSGTSEKKKAAVGVEGGGGKEGGGEEVVFLSGGYKPAEYKPAEYHVAEYKSVYEKP